MFDIGGVELLVVAVVTIIVVGPKDLPGMLRRAGRMVGKVRGMANEFKTHFDDVADQEEFKEIRQSLDAVKEISPTNQIKEALSPFEDAGNSIKETMDKAEKAPAEKAKPAAAKKSTAQPKSKAATKTKKTVTQKAAPKKIAAKKTATKKTTAKKAAPKKAAPKKAAVKKTAAKKPRKAAEKAGA